MTDKLSPAAQALLKQIKTWPGLTTAEYAKDLEKPVASVRRDIQVLRSHGLIKGEPNTDMAEEDGYPPNTFYWWVPIP